MADVAARENAHAQVLKSVGITTGYRRYALILLTVVYTANYVDRQVLSILLEPIKLEFALSDTELGFLSGIAFAIFYATLGIPIAMLADRWNRRHIITISLTIFSGMTVVCGLATSFIMLALARIGVAIGEAGSSPPSHAIISDLYPPEKRATALAIFALGVNVGILIGFLMGGWVNELYGWRVAFLVAGVPGLLLAFVVHFTLKEPPRGLSDGMHGRQIRDAPSVAGVFSFLWSQKAFRHIAAGSTLVSFVGYGAVIWLPAYLIRSHGMSTGEIGTALALIIGIAGGIGTYFGGMVADKLGERDVRWNMWTVAIAGLVSFPFAVVVYLATSATVALTAFVIPALLGVVYLAPSLAMTQALVTLRMRATASAILLFILNIIGLGLGPQTVGVISDLLQPTYGVESLRYALLITSALGLWGALHFYLAARYLKDDIAKSRALETGTDPAPV